MDKNKWLLDNIVNLSIGIVAATWAIWNYFYTKKKEETKILTELYTKYNSRAMIEMRATLWLKIEEFNNEKSEKTFSKLWSELNDEGQIKEYETTINIYEFGAFWNEMLCLHRSKLIKKTLAKQFFGYQYSYWKHHLTGFVKRTLDNDSDSPDILTAFSSKELDWLEFSGHEKRIYKMHKIDIEQKSTIN